MEKTQTKIEEELGRGGQLSIINLIDGLVEHAFNSRASDIHIDPEEKRVRIRLRIDGVLHESFIFPKEIHSEIITRIKVLSGLRTDEHQAAQDGRFRLVIKKTGPIDIRVSITPTYYGENCVMRILAEKSEKFSIDNLGFSEKDKRKIEKAIRSPYGMILVTGPTGSGKTTTLYTFIKVLSKPEISIITIEDPIEYSISGIDQIQVNSRTGLTFANGLRSILRQDPNIIMVGEIRDEETARIAVNAALTGHLLFSTLHTNDAPTTLPRLLDMKIEPFLIASTINIAIGQRLVRKICENCKTKQAITMDEMKSLSEILPEKILSQYKEFYRGTGCEKCDNTGYHGRLGIYEVMEIDDDIRAAVVRKADSDEIKRIAVKNGMTTMIEDGLKKVLEGVTTVEEILRVIHE
jgi:type IV pilus assembly protein PilB